MRFTTSLRGFTLAFWLAVVLFAVSGLPTAKAQMFGGGNQYEGLRTTPSGRPTGAPEDEAPKPKTRPGEDVPLMATPSGAANNSTLVERHIDELPNAKAKSKEKLNLEDTLYLDLSYGRVVIKLHPELAPKTVARFKELTRQGFYDGLVFHRVIEGFMAQTGDPRGDGTGGSGQNLNAEFNAGKHVRGSLSMARAANINSADSQFFIVLADAPHLDGQYTYFGEVVSGMEFVDEIRKGDPRRNGQVAYPDHILRLQVAADAEKNEKGGKVEASATKPAKKNEPKGG